MSNTAVLYLTALSGLINLWGMMLLVSRSKAASKNWLIVIDAEWVNGKATTQFIVVNKGTPDVMLATLVASQQLENLYSIPFEVTFNSCYNIDERSAKNNAPSSFYIRELADTADFNNLVTK